MSKRLIVNIVIFSSLLFLPFIPWYITFLMAIVASWYFVYYEILLVGLIMDLMYSSSLFFHTFDRPYSIPFLSAGLVTMIILQSLKNKVRFYA